MLRPRNEHRFGKHRSGAGALEIIGVLGAGCGGMRLDSRAGDGLNLL